MSGFGKTVGGLFSGISGGFLWKLGAGAAVILSVVLVGLLIAANAETRDITRQRNELAVAINDPQTGYVARLAQQRTNTAQLQAGLERQIIVMREEAARNERVLASTRAALNAAQAESRRDNARVAELMRNPPRGNTLEERVTDIDNRILEDLRNGQ